MNFAACETRQCVNVTIVDDTPNEPVDVFDITLERTLGLDTRISLDPVDARVVIYDEKSKSVRLDNCVKSMCTVRWVI